MKKIMLFILALGLGSTITSCKKDYICKCTKTYTGATSSYTTDDGLYSYKDSKVRAIERCNKNDGTNTDSGGEYSRNCDIN